MLKLVLCVLVLLACLLGNCLKMTFSETSAKSGLKTVVEKNRVKYEFWGTLKHFKIGFEEIWVFGVHH